MKFSKIELRDLLKSWIALSLAFTIVNVGFNLGFEFIIGFLISGFTVGIGFLLHEMAHKLLAQRYGCFAEFRSNDKMLLLAVFVSFLGFVFAAPGAVHIIGRITKDQHGKIASVGIVTNLLLSILFLFLGFFGGIFLVIGAYGATINAWLALFNLIPFGRFDGFVVMRWNKIIYGVLIVVAAIMLMLPGLFFG